MTWTRDVTRPVIEDGRKYDSTLEYNVKVGLERMGLVMGRDFMHHARVDGVYSDDPEKNPHAILYPELSYQQVREQNLRVMDATAISQCMEHGMPILVFNYRRDGNIERAVAGERIGTLIGTARRPEAVAESQ